MLHWAIEQRIRSRIVELEATRWFLPFISLSAFLLTVTFTVPVTSLLVPAVLLQPKSWRQVTLTAALGSALGATLLLAVFHHAGWQQIQAWFPEMQNSSKWLEVMRYTRDYGVAALGLIAALPLPQTPALIVGAISDLPDGEVFLAVLLGKLLKYGVVCGLASYFPNRFRGLG